MPAGVDYVQYFYPGVIMLVLLFTAIFATISTVEDRREGFLQGVLVAPISRATVVVGPGARRHHAGARRRAACFCCWRRLRESC